MVKRDGKVPNELLGNVAAFLFPIAALGESMYLSALIFLLILAVGLWYVYSPRTRIADVAATLMGPLYTGFMLSASCCSATRSGLSGRAPHGRGLCVALGFRLLCLPRWPRNRAS